MITRATCLLYTSSKAFGDKELFSGVELDVKRGEKLAIIGPNGTGKTTLLKTVSYTHLV